MQNNFPKLSFFVSITLFCVSLFAFIFLYRLINNNDNLSQAKESEWKTETARRDEIKTLDRTIRTIENERAELETHFTRSSDVVAFLDIIEKLAISAGAKGEVTSVDVSEDHAGLYVGMKASGTFNSLYKFLTLLENSYYELAFISMNMHKGSTSDQDNKKSTVPLWDLVIKMKLLSFIE